MLTEMLNAFNRNTAGEGYIDDIFLDNYELTRITDDIVERNDAVLYRVYPVVAVIFTGVNL